MEHIPLKFLQALLRYWEDKQMKVKLEDAV
jgi:hypothetical protein